MSCNVSPHIPIKTLYSGMLIFKNSIVMELYVGGNVWYKTRNDGRLAYVDSNHTGVDIIEARQLYRITPTAV